METNARWPAVLATAVATALVTSTATVGIVRLMDVEEPAPQQTTAAQEATVREAKVRDWSGVAAQVRPSVVAIAVEGREGSGEGSGVIVDTDGLVITNDHVVAGARDIAVTLVDGRVYEARLVGSDPTTDVAVIRVVDPPDDLVAATLGDSDAVEVGDPVMAVGNPLGLDSTVTTGIVSAVDRPVSTGGAGREPVVTNAIQVDAAINPGNSGGPLFDTAGRVVGITSSILTMSRASGSIGLGFAIPVNLASRVADQLVADGTVEHAYLGVQMSDGRATLDGATRVGARIEEVLAGTPAAEAGLERGDVVVAVDGDAVSGAESLTAQVRERAPGEEVTLTVVRDDEPREVTVTLGSREELLEDVSR